MQGTLAEQYAREFPASKRRAGIHYFKTGRVRIVRGGTESVEALVRGSRAYRVRLAYENDALSFDCSCPNFNEGFNCKHIWAVLLAADHHGFLQTPPAPGESPSRPLGWRAILEGLPRPAVPTPASTQVVYWLDPQGRFHVGTRKRLQRGGWGSVQERKPYGGWIPPEDRGLMALVAAGLKDVLYPRLCATGRFFRSGKFEQPLRWEDAPWRLKLVPEHEAQQWIFRGEFVRGEERLDLTAPRFVDPEGFLVTDEAVARFEGRPEWIRALARAGGLSVPAYEIKDFRRELVEMPDAPEVDWPEPLRLEVLGVPPVPRLRLSRDLEASLAFDYGEALFEAEDPRPRAIVGKFVVVRDLAAELRARERLRRFGKLTADTLRHLVHDLSAEGWKIEAERGSVRRPGEFKIEVTSGMDWFDLKGGVTFEGRFVPFPKLLAALREGRQFVTLGDGTTGVLPEEWLRKMEFVLRAGEVKGESLRFQKSQTLLLDALLAEQETATCDRAFAELRERLRQFEGVRPLDPPPGFRGELRPYQKLGLGWMAFLREFGFGGCLADDMGLGKTVQVLALLASRKGPALVVVPRSLLWNWKSEAARFAPGLRVLDFTGPSRKLEDVDLILTTYGTLRRDAEVLKDVRFDYVILDEAQAIKNPRSITAKAARLLRGDHRLALSGTPVENHLGELWSLFEFLNPGMLGRVGADLDREVLARAIRPFLLRRTKEQVAPELPAKVEQTIYCDLEPSERKRYDELRDHYRQSLATQDLRRAKIQVLEALLRLRQAACHPGLIDKALRSEPSTKVDLLLEHLAEVVDEGHKALVFSQFTSLLAIVRERLDREHIRYEYLDGQTRDRATPVSRFQNDPDVRLFLISLKAGGLGLNLTAAEYAFLLDPWWNPAVEAQAIDRAHRIGQTRQVFAYRIVARGTVEEKVLELQSTKRALADAIVNADNALLRDLTPEDLALLLS